jgi:hypothetical protein
MELTAKIRAYGGDKIALLGLLVLGLLLAYWITVRKSAIDFCEPVPLSETGLAVAVPDGGPWQSDTQWRPIRQGLELVSSFKVARRQAVAQVECRYLLAVRDTGASGGRLQQEALRLEARIEQTGRYTVSGLEIEWAKLSRAGSALVIFFGTASLPSGAVLDIKVYEAAVTARIAKDVFDQTVQRVQYESDPMVQDGAALVRQIEQAGLREVLGGEPTEEYFMIRASDGGAMGFSVDKTRFTAEPNVTAQSYIYLASAGREQFSVFRGSVDLSRFSWRTVTVAARGGRRQVHISRGADGLLQVSGERASGATVYRPAGSVIPEMFFASAAERMLVSGYDEALVQILMGGGRFRLARLCRAGQTDAGLDTVHMELVGEDGYRQTLYFDDAGRIQRIERADYVLEHSSYDDILNSFGEKADVLKKLREGGQQTEELESI